MKSSKVGKKICAGKNCGKNQHVNISRVNNDKTKMSNLGIIE